MNEVYKTLEQLKIPYKHYNHPAVYTVEEAEREIKNIEGTQTKNLFLREKKGKRHYLIILPANQDADIKSLAFKLKEKRLSFASPERLKEYLGLDPGSVSPFGLMNDKDCRVSVVIEEKLKKAEKIGFHPNKNTATVVLSWNGFEKFLGYTGNPISYLSTE